MASLLSPFGLFGPKRASLPPWEAAVAVLSSELAPNRAPRGTFPPLPSHPLDVHPPRPLRPLQGGEEATGLHLAPVASCCWAHCARTAYEGTALLLSGLSDYRLLPQELLLFPDQSPAPPGSVLQVVPLYLSPAACSTALSCLVVGRWTGPAPLPLPWLPSLCVAECPGSADPGCGLQCVR
eukprot:GGOE01007529.1.p2 GENE.GGOE01007529.1~~GGOE01007529.1.p2  ORF type:complete len:181 (-),score=2.25 GGOE01007529.1:279-821(-)